MKNFPKLLIVLISLTLVTSCSKKDKDNPQPTPDNTTIASVTSTSVSSITSAGAVSGGNVTADGGSTVTARGVCWSTSTGPTISNSKTTDGSGTGSFSSSITGLSENQTYYVRAYATNAKGTAYGNELQFTTAISGGPCPGGSTTVVDIDGNVYNIVTIGNQCWTKENLKTTRYRNGDLIETGLSDAQWLASTDGAYAVYDNNPANNTIYGKLYNHYAVKDPRGLCPAGFHTPSYDEWNRLVKYLDPAADTSFSHINYSLVAGGYMKATGTIQAGTGLWTSPNVGATNSSDFTALPSGIRSLFGPYEWLNNSVYFASSTSIPGSNDCYYIYLDHAFATVWRMSYNFGLGVPVRCVMD